MEIKQFYKEQDNRIKDILFRILTKFRFESLYVYFQRLEKIFFRKLK